ncbi:MAG: hypothetical protein ACUVV6_01915 [Thermoplasmatota archaeon]
MKRWVGAALLGVVGLAILMRFAPLLEFSIWGSDSGEYYQITKLIVESGALGGDYIGWGFGYPYFPGMFLLTGEVVELGGAPLLETLLLVAPLVACLSMVAIFLIGLEAFRDPRAGLFAAAYLSVCTPHVFATSHPMPGSVGDFLALLCILLLLKSVARRWAIPALALATPALIVTHHLSTFFVLVPVLLALLAREALRLRTDARRARVEGGYLLYLYSLALLFWFVYAVPFRERVLTEAFHTSPWAVLGLAVLCLAAVPCIVALRRRLAPGLRYMPSFPSLKRAVAGYGVFVAGGAAVMAGVALASAPGTAINVDEFAAIWFLPQVFVLGLAVAGVGWAEFSREGLFVLLWLGAIALTLVIGVATENHVLLPYRQTQYLMEPLALFAGAGAMLVHDQTNLERRVRTSLAAAGVLLTGVLLVGATSYPPKGILGGFEEGTSAAEMDSALWLRDGRGGWELLATDHRMSSICFGIAGINASWDDARMTLHGNLSEAEEEIGGLEVPSGHHAIDLVLLSPSVVEGAALVQWESARPIEGAALAKFGSPLFVKIYEAGGVVVFCTRPPEAR